MHRKEIIRLGLVASIAIALLPGARAADGPPQVTAVALATVVDSTGKAVGSVIGSQNVSAVVGGPISIMAGAGGLAFWLLIDRDGLFSSLLMGPLFATSDCSGTPYVYPPDPSAFVMPSAIGLPGKSLYAPQPGAIGRFVTLASAMYSSPSVPTAFCGALPPPPPGVPPNNTLFVVPAVPLVDLNTVFKPPFSLRIKAVSGDD
jgi:hypothetical protein